MITRGQKYVKKNNNNAFVLINEFSNGIVDFHSVGYFDLKQASEELFLETYTLFEEPVFNQSKNQINVL